MDKFLDSDVNKGTNMFPHHRVCGMISFIPRNFEVDSTWYSTNFSNYNSLVDSMYSTEYKSQALSKSHNGYITITDSRLPSHLCR